MTEKIAWLLEGLNRLVWGFPALLLILGVGGYLSIRTGFVQLRKLGLTFKTIWQKLRQPPEPGGVSPFQALCTALAATVGTGNIAGVAGAIAIGGPGAVFWMWVAAFLGMAVKYGEVVLAVRYREPGPDGAYLGGPMYYIRNGLGHAWGWLGSLYCCFGVIAAFGVGNSTQVSTAVASINQALAAFGHTPGFRGNLVMGLILGLLVGLVVLGGARRIGSVAEYLIPVMSLGYILLSLGAIACNRQALPGALEAIFAGAASPRACTGGAVGSLFITLRIGVSRGVFTNEAGMGTASIAHAGAKTRHPCEQGLYGIFEVFADTIVICTMTALVILTSGVSIPYGVDAGAELTVTAFVSVYGSWVTVFLAVSMALFAFATILGWGLYGTRCAEFLFGGKSSRLFALLHAATTILGALIAPALLWDLAEVVNGLMAIPNLIALLALSPEILRLTGTYFEQTERRKSGHAGRNSYENLHQRKPLRALSHAEVPPSGGGRPGAGPENLPSEHWPA
ncbi:MAG: sodium:alanine symporter family protein [Candidatus Faecousia sp.]|nr:sodium:alanine symporter family protein [Clostridiales bacterium]MDD7652649.1 sodium:alanine symporter family protein [Bacillota bacterium]MDY4219365.1 sodium:alanine symporter family protein [Candidatus Faecousia sp.]